MAITHGMNPDEVKGLGTELKNAGEQIQSIMKTLNSKIQGTTWVGEDATQFKDDAWPSNKSIMQQTAGMLEEFGQKAITNAERQMDTSKTL